MKKLIVLLLFVFVNTMLVNSQIVTVHITKYAASATSFSIDGVPTNRFSNKILRIDMTYTLDFQANQCNIHAVVIEPGTENIGLYPGKIIDYTFEIIDVSIIDGYTVVTSIYYDDRIRVDEVLSYDMVNQKSMSKTITQVDYITAVIATYDHLETSIK